MTVACLPFQALPGSRFLHQVEQATPPPRSRYPTPSSGLFLQLGVTLKGSGKGKPIRTCFELGDGAEEGRRPLGAGIYEADRVMAIVESDLAEGTE